jgi:hypothetical protein
VTINVGDIFRSKTFKDVYILIISKGDAGLHEVIYFDGIKVSLTDYTLERYYVKLDK